MNQSISSNEWREVSALQILTNVSRLQARVHPFCLDPPMKDHHLTSGPSPLHPFKSSENTCSLSTYDHVDHPAAVRLLRRNNLTALREEAHLPPISRFQARTGASGRLRFPSSGCKSSNAHADDTRTLNSSAGKDDKPSIGSLD